MTASPVEEVKSRVDLVDLIGSTVALRQSGRSYRALCPFHSEKTPSFYVFPETQTWKCFGCGAGGDAFSFLMQRDNLEFGEALRELAARAGVELESRVDPERQEADDRLRRANEATALYYHALLMQQPAGLAAGLVVERDEGSGVVRDRFRHRLMFPIRDPQGRTIGFGGRTLTPDGVPKYLNSPQTALFEKASVLYALDQARDPIRAERRAV